MSNLSETATDMERYLQNMCHEILYEIFRRLPKDKLIDVSKLCSIFRDTAGDTRFWKCIKYETLDGPLDFEDLYSGPFPVREIHFSNTEINPPVSPDIGQVVKVTTLNLTSTNANKITLEAILAKHQCSELIFDYNRSVSPEAFLKQTFLEVLSIRDVKDMFFEDDMSMFCVPCHFWLGQVLSNCKNLKTLDLSCNEISDFDMRCFAKKLPTSLETLKLPFIHHDRNFFLEVLAGRTPNLRELQLYPTDILKSPYLHRFRFLETLGVILTRYGEDVNNFNTYLIDLPVLNTVHVHIVDSLPDFYRIKVEKFQKTLEFHAFSVKLFQEHEQSSSPKDDNLWKITKRKLDWDLGASTKRPKLRRMEGLNENESDS